MKYILLLFLLSLTFSLEVLSSQESWSQKIQLHTGASIQSLHIGRPQTPCGSPSLWLFLLGQHRTFQWTKPSHLKMVQESAPNKCWYVIMATGTSIGDEKDRVPNSGLAPPDKRPVDYVGQLLSEDTKKNGFFSGRFAYVSLDLARVPGRPNVKLHAPWKIALKTHAYAAWALSRMVAEAEGFEVDPRSVLVRSRPDMLFSASFHLHEFQAHFSSPPWYHHLQVGQQIDADLNMFSSYGMWQQDVARPMEHPTAGVLHTFSSGNMWSRSGYMAAQLPECVCLSGIDLQDTHNISNCPSKDVACHPYVFEGWGNHLICRFRSPNHCTDHKWGLVPVNIAAEVKSIYASTACEMYALPSRSIIPTDSTDVIDLSYAPGKYHRRSREASSLSHFKQGIISKGSYIDLQTMRTHDEKSWRKIPVTFEAASRSCRHPL